MATNTTRTSASNASEVTPRKKTGKRRMKKQVRRTLGALFLASAIAVAAIPVEPMSAKNGTIAHTEDPSTNIVRSVHYADYDNDPTKYEKIPGQTDDADAAWRSKVPLVEKATFDTNGNRLTGDAIYVDENMAFQFAFVQESSVATDSVAVLVGVTNSAISTSGSLTIPDSVDAYLQYTANTTKGGYCAVNRNGDFLYYSTTSQINDKLKGYMYKANYYDAMAVDTNKYPTAANDFGGLQRDDAHKHEKDVWSVTDATSIQTVPANVSATENEYGVVFDGLSAGDEAYAFTYTKFIASETTPTMDPEDPTDPTSLPRYHGEWKTLTAYSKLNPQMELVYAPCYLDQKGQWTETDGSDKELYYWTGDNNSVDLKDTTGKFVSIVGKDTAYQRLHAATVRYIGMQKVVSDTKTRTNTDGDLITITNWTVTDPTTVTTGGTLDEKPSNGVFYGNANLRDLTIGPMLAGIGDYAFYSCTALSSVTFSSQLNTIGNGAFKGCNNLRTVNLDPWTNLTVIGASAFEGCAGLTSFDIPVAVTAIGDRAFKNCATSTGGIRNIYMCGEHATGDSTPPMNLVNIGYNAFENDEYLEYLEFPASLSQKMPVHYLNGCTRLNRIKSNNPSFDVIDGDWHLDGDYGATATDFGTYDPTVEIEKFHHKTNTNPNGIDTCDIDDWLKTLENEDFYFESLDNYVLHQTAIDHSAAFNYDDAGKEDWFEIVMRCDETDNNGPHESTFVVDTNNNLVSVNINKDCSVITIPGSIGGHGVSNIAEGCFTNNCSLKKVYIPASVSEIAPRAFRGCHNLNTVYFTEPYNYNLTIGEGAFDTQDGVSSHGITCPTGALSNDPQLNFVGAIDGNYAPYAYAMNGSNNINVGSQPTAYITYYSGWPTFLQVKYNPDRVTTGDENELVSYPTRKYLTDMDTAADLNLDDALEKYPFMSKEDFAALNNAVNIIQDPVNNTGTQDETICANSIYDLEIPYGVESIKEGLFSNLKQVYLQDLAGNYIDVEGKVIDSSNDLEKILANKPEKLVRRAEQVGTVDNTDLGINTLGSNKVLKSVKLNSIQNVDPYTFANMNQLETVDITGNDTIGDYAFCGGDKLKNVSISGDTYSIGIRPFADCPVLDGVSFTGANFNCEDAIIYGLSGGNKASIVECLETRGQGSSNTVVSAKEMAGITSMQDEAFMNCDSVETVNLTDSALSIIPPRAFAATDGLYLVELPQGLKTIKKDAFLDSNVKQVSIPGMNTNIQDENVFCQTVNKGTRFYQGLYSLLTKSKADVAGDNVEATEYNPYVDESARTGKVTFNTPEGSFAEQYADDHSYIQATAAAVTYKVTFKDPENEGDAQILEVQDVASGECAQIPRGWNPNSHSGKTFLGWESSANDNVYSDTEVPTVPITETTTYKARYSGGTCTVTFIDKDNNVITTKEVTYGNDVSAPEAPTVENYTFKGWDRYPVSSDGLTNIVEDTTFKATYEKVDSSDKHHVVFYNYDDSIVSEQYIADGEAAQTPANPSREGYTFTGWKPADFTNITKDTDIYAQFEKNASGGGGGGGGSSSGNSGGNKSPSGNSSSGNSSNAKTYTVTVINGSGSGTYAEGSTVVIAANDPAKGKAFDKWTTADASLASTTLSATTFKMPGKNVTVTANYKDAPSSSSGTVKYATGNSGRPPATGRTATGSTQVQVNKGGVSNVDLASATVRGSTDSFIVKVTETNEATNLVENALNNRFGGLDALKYWPCDISLYDSTGNTKITDTTGLTVEITLPIPDEFRKNGGNTKVAAVSNGQLEDLGTRFNTVNGTPTVTFTATHFSPYVIYADTNNLVASEMLDASPKTGDPIHPKWFLAIALAAGSVFMFLKKDKKPAVAAA